MKVFLDFLPVTLFFVVYKMADKTRDILNAFLPESASVWLADQSDFILATLFLIPATLIPIIYVWQKERRIEKMHVITFAIVLLMGGLTIALDSPVFLKWKPTIVSWAFGLVFGVSLLFNRNLLQKLLGDQITLPATVWTRLTLFWIGYFFITGLINIYVAYQFSEEIWVDFKLFGMLGLTLVFVVIQGFYLSQHIKPEE